jgi:hypothetical protein
MSIDTRTPAERAYDAQRDGSAYVKPEPAGDSGDLIEVENALKSDTAIGRWLRSQAPANAKEANRLFFRAFVDEQLPPDVVAEIDENLEQARQRELAELENETVIAEWIDANAPAVRIERSVCGDSGQEQGTRFFAGAGDAEVEVHVPDPGKEQDWPVVYMFGHDGIAIAEVEAVLPHLTTLLADPRVQAARAAWQAVGFVPYSGRMDPGAPAEEMSILDAYQAGWKDGRAALIEEIKAKLDSRPQDAA